MINLITVFIVTLIMGFFLGVAATFVFFDTTPEDDDDRQEEKK